MRSCSIFESFFFDLLKIFLFEKPAERLSNKKIDVSTVTKAADINEVIAYIVDKELNDLKYEKIRDWFEYLFRLIRIGYPTDDKIGQIAEIKAARDIIIHNSHIVNQIYLAKSKDFARWAIGDKIAITSEYFNSSWALLLEAVETISSKICEKIS